MRAEPSSRSSGTALTTSYPLSVPHARIDLMMLNLTTTPMAAVLPLVAAAALAGILALLARTRPLGGWSALVVFIAAFVTQALLLGLPSAALSAGGAVIVFAVLVFSRVLNRTNAFVLPALFALIPLAQWWAFLPALLVLVVVAVAKLARTQGLRNITTTVTHAAILTHSNGIADAGNIVDDHLDTPEATVQPPRINVLACLACGFILAAGIQALIIAVS